MSRYASIIPLTVSDGKHVLAQNMGPESATVVSCENLSILKSQAEFFSTVRCLKFNNRYPSPLKRSVHVVRPLFSLRIPAHVNGRKSHHHAEILAHAKVYGTRAQHRSSSRYTQAGEDTCVKHSSYWQPSRHLQHATQTRNADLSVRSLARLSLRPRAATPPQAPLSAAQQACSATMQAFVSKTHGASRLDISITGHRSNRRGGLFYVQNSATRRGRRT